MQRAPTSQDEPPGALIPPRLQRFATNGGRPYSDEMHYVEACYALTPIQATRELTSCAGLETQELVLLLHLQEVTQQDHHWLLLATGLATGETTRRDD